MGNVTKPYYMKAIIQNTWKKFYIFLFFFLFLNANAQGVSTFAGNGNSGLGDGIGTAAEFFNPFGIAVDAAGNVYVGDYNNNAIRKITNTGVVSTFAGGCNYSYCTFYGPTGVAVDTAGNVYVADTFYHRIRKITPAGLVSTLAGGTQGYADGTGDEAKFNNPRGVAVDAAGNVYVADGWNHRIRKITAAGVVTTLAGSTQGYADDMGAAAEFFGPNGVAVDAAGNVFVADEGNNCIRKITAAGMTTTLAGSGVYGYADGPGISARFAYPNGLAIDPVGNIIVVDRNNNRIRKVTAAGVVSTFAGSTHGYAEGLGAAAQFNYPTGVAVDATGAMYVADELNHRIRKIKADLASANSHQKVTVYPNPASSIINIELEDVGGAEVKIFDMNGRFLERMDIVGDRGFMDIGSFGRGVYLLEIDGGKGKVLSKVVKE